MPGSPASSSTAAPSPAKWRSRTASTVPRRIALSAIIAGRAQGCPGGRAHLGGYLGGWLFLVRALAAAQNRGGTGGCDWPHRGKEPMMDTTRWDLQGVVLAVALALGPLMATALST